MGRQYCGGYAPAVCGLAACALLGGLVVWPAWTSPSASLRPDVGETSLLQIATDQEMRPEALRIFCDEEMAAVGRLLDSVGGLTGEPLLWASNQIDSRLQDVGSLG